MIGRGVTDARRRNLLAHAAARTTSLAVYGREDRELPTEWAVLLAAVIAGVATFSATVMSGATGVVNAYFMRWRDRVTRVQYAHDLGMFGAFAAVLRRLEELPGVDRALVFTGKNGGGRPRPGYKYTVRAQDVWSRKPGETEHLRDFYGVDLPVDEHYVAMLLAIIQYGQVTNVTTTMPEDSQLRGYYDVEGVVSSIIYFLAINLKSQELSFVSVASYKAEFTRVERVRIEMQVEQLRSLVAEGGAS